MFISESIKEAVNPDFNCLLFSSVELFMPQHKLLVSFNEVGLVVQKKEDQ